MSQQTKKINNILNDRATTLGQLINKANAIASLDTMIQDMLPKELKGRYKVASYEKGILTFLTNNGATATQIRYQTPELMRVLRLNPQWAGLINIKVKVHLYWHEFEAPKQKPTSLPINQTPKPILSEQVKESIQAVIDNLNLQLKGNEAIQKILKKLMISET